MPNTTLRIVIPTQIEELLKLGEMIYQKHLADGKESPLSTLQDYAWTSEGPNIALALEKHKQAEALTRQAEKMYRERDKLIVNAKGITTSSRDVLKGIYKKTPKKLGDWGFTVDDTPKVKVKKTTP